MNDEKLISVIIPVYNSERYLEECLESVVNQTYRNIEIILINDGSTDKSPEICRQYAMKDGRIQYISQENAGEAAARNCGIKAAGGELILFVDSDDMLTLDICEQVCREMQDYDLMFLHYQTFRNASEIRSRFSGPGADREDLCRYSAEDWVRSLLGPKGTVPAGLNLNSIWAKAYRRQFIEDNGIEFQRNVLIGEDVLFNLQVYLKTPKACCLPVNACFYRYNDASVVHRYNPDFQLRDQRFFAELSSILLRENLLSAFQEELGYQKVNGLLQIFSSDMFHPNNLKSGKEKKTDFLAVVSRAEYREQIPAQMKNFVPVKRFALYFAMKKQYFPLKIMYQVKDLLNRIK